MKKPQEPKTQQRRMPRPQGLTEKALQFQDPKLSQPQKTQRKKLLQHNLITSYLYNNYTINSEYVDVNRLSLLLGIPLQQTIGMINDRTKLYGRLMNEVPDHEQTRVLIFEALNGVRQSASMALNQAQLLGTLQGPNYVPFLTSAVTQAISTHTQSLKPMLDIIKLLQPANTGSRLPTGPLPIDPNQPTITAQVTPDEAFKMIENKLAQLLIDGPKRNELLAQKYSIEDPNLYPDITASAANEASIMALTLKKKAAENDGELDISDAQSILKRGTLIDFDEEPNPSNPLP